MIREELLTANRSPRYLARVEFIQALREELIARGRFQDEQSHENLTAWADARNLLEDRKRSL